MELFIFFLLVTLIGLLALDLGSDSRPCERDHAHNW
jgi:hypothetical protein